MPVLILIRHGLTKGNLEHRYIGQRTDEPLCIEGIRLLEEGRAAYPKSERVYTSPMLRCVQTAAVLYPEQKPVILESLKETDFGIFEGRTAEELTGNAAFQDWIDSGGSMRFPGGEDPSEVEERCEQALEYILAECRKESFHTAAIVTHGGPIMYLMQILVHSGRKEGAGPDYSWSVQNGGGFMVAVEDGTVKEYHPIAVG